MTDLRLAVVAEGADAEDYRRLAPRLHGAEIVAIGGGVDEFGARDDVDAVVICRPHDLDAARAAAAGKHLLIDGTPADAAHIQQLSEPGPAHLMIGCRAWHRPSFQSLLASIQAGRIGTPGLLRLHRWRPAGSGYALQPADLAEEVVLADAVFGSSAEVACASQTEAGAGGSLLLHLGFPGGGMALLEVAEIEGGAGYETLSVIGSTGAAYADDHHNMQLAFANRAPEAVLTGESAAGLLAQTQEFIDMVREDRQPGVTIDTYRQALLTVAAARESLAVGGAVTSPT